MSSYVVVTANLESIGEATTEDGCKKLMRADVMRYGNRGPYLAGNGYTYTASVEMARSANKRITVVARTDTHALDPRYPDGVPPSPTPLIQVAAPLPQTGQVGVAFSVSFASSVTGADAPPNSYTLSGSVPGLSFNTGTGALTGTPTTAGTYSVTLGAIDTSVPFSAPGATLITINPAVVTDTLPPTVPKMLTVAMDTVALTNTIAGDYPVDTRSATISPTDNVRVELYESVDGAGFSLLTTKVASGPQPSIPLLQLTQIGGAAAGSLSQSGADFTISAVTNGAYGRFTEILNYAYALISLPVGGRVGVTLPAFSGAGYNECSLMVRSSLTSMAPSLAWIRRADGVNNAAPPLARATQGGDTVYNVDATMSGEVDVVIERLSSNQWRFDQYDAAAGTITTVTTHTVVMPTQVYIGGHLATNDNAGPITATWKNLWVSTQARWSHVRSGLVNSHTYAYKVRGGDGA